jgi:hypothetical protein
LPASPAVNATGKLGEATTKLQNSPPRSTLAPSWSCSSTITLSLSGSSTVIGPLLLLRLMNLRKCSASVIVTVAGPV